MGSNCCCPLLYYMEEEKKMQPEQEDQQLNENAAAENAFAAGEQQTENPKLQTEEMEVHKHPHHVAHKKKWGEYFLEFLMLFLAVFLGFMAENVREHRI